MALLETDPIDWALDSTGDLVVPIRYTRGLDGVAQGIRVRLSLARRELFYNFDAGVPYVAAEGVDPALVILGNRFDPVRAEAAVREAIMKAPGVGSITALAVTLDSRTRAMRVTASVKALFGGTVSVDESVAVGAAA